MNEHDDYCLYYKLKNEDLIKLTDISFVNNKHSRAVLNNGVVIDLASVDYVGITNMLESLTFGDLKNGHPCSN